MKDDNKKKQTPKKNVKKTTAKPAAGKQPQTVKSTAPAKKPAVKKTTAKKPAVAPKKKPAANQKELTAKKTTSKTNYPKHSDKDERKVGAERPIIINGKAKAPKNASAQPSKAAVTQRKGRVSSITYHIKYD